MNLVQGVANKACFSVTTKYQGTSVCECEIWFWRYSDKIIISDIDGTITKWGNLFHFIYYFLINIFSGRTFWATFFHGSAADFGRISELPNYLIVSPPTTTKFCIWPHGRSACRSRRRSISSRLCKKNIRCRVVRFCCLRRPFSTPCTGIDFFSFFQFFESILIFLFFREVIEKKPEIFKTGCLRDIASLYPSTINPFYAGFGNRPNVSLLFLIY